jgi:ribosomal protein S27AE
MSTTGFLRELLFPGPRRLHELAALVEQPIVPVSNLLQSAMRCGFVTHLARGLYGLTDKGRARVLAQARECEICGEAPPVGVVVYLHSDPVTTRLVCGDCATMTV